MPVNNPDLFEPVQSLKHRIYDVEAMNVQLSHSIPKKARLLKVSNLTFPRSMGWLDGRSPQGPWSVQSMQQIPVRTHNKGGIHKSHILKGIRHNSTDQLPEIGKDQRYTQDLLGHTSSRTSGITSMVAVITIKK